MSIMVRHNGISARAATAVLFAALLLAGPRTAAQSVRSLVNGGNDLYKEQKYSDAEVNYRKALDRERELVQGHFNLGNALHKQGKFGDAVKEFETALTKAEQADTKAFAHYNIGNAKMKEEQYQDAVRAYIDALRLNPEDEDAKYNLSYALEKLKQKQEQQKNNKDKQNQNKDDKQKQNEKQKNKPEDKKQNQDQKDQQEKQKQNPGQQQRKMSRADAQRILDVLKDNEKEVQKKLRVRQAVRARTDKDW